jgi:hypothetical protein
MFENPLSAPRAKSASKEMILQQADGLRDLARRARRLASTLTNEADQRRLGRYVEELEDNATRLEKNAAEAKSG